MRLRTLQSINMHTLASELGRAWMRWRCRTAGGRALNRVNLSGLHPPTAPTFANGRHFSVQRAAATVAQCCAEKRHHTPPTLKHASACNAAQHRICIYMIILWNHCCFAYALRVVSTISVFVCVCVCARVRVSTYHLASCAHATGALICAICEHAQTHARSQNVRHLSRGSSHTHTHGARVRASADSRNICAHEDVSYMRADRFPAAWRGAAVAKSCQWRRRRRMYNLAPNPAHTRTGVNAIHIVCNEIKSNAITHTHTHMGETLRHTHAHCIM